MIDRVDRPIEQLVDDILVMDCQSSLLGMVGEFYTRKMLSMVILAWPVGIIFTAGAVFSGIKFFRTNETQYQIMYAVVFRTCVQWVGPLKVFAWQMIHRNSIKREIKRLELRTAEPAGAIEVK